MPAQRTSTPRNTKTKSYARPYSSTDEVYVDSADERTPTLSPNGSDDNDRSSDFDPAFETPSKAGKSNAQSLYVFDDDDDDEEMKPDFSDDEISYPGIVDDHHRQESEDEEMYGKKGKGKGKGKANPTPKKTTPKKASGSVGGSGKKPGVGWTPEEDWMLFQKLHPKVSKPDWKAVGDAVMRDGKSCQNRYAVFSKRLEGLIKGMSGR